ARATAHADHLAAPAVAADDRVDLERGVGARRRRGLVLGDPLVGGLALFGVEDRIFEFRGHQLYSAFPGAGARSFSSSALSVSVCSRARSLAWAASRSDSRAS